MQPYSTIWSLSNSDVRFKELGINKYSSEIIRNLNTVLTKNMN